MQPNPTRNPIATIAPYLATVFFTLLIATLFCFAINNWRLIEGRRPEPGAPIFYDAARPIPPGAEPIRPSDFPDPPGERTDPEPGFRGALPGGAAPVPFAEPITPDRAGTPPPRFDPDEWNNINVYEAVNRSVVNISTSATIRGLFQDTEVSGAGSGFVINKQGHILTNHHVVEGAEVVQVGFYDGSIHDARVVGTDPSNDVAVLQVAAPQEKLYPMVLGESSDLKVGQKVLALGNPFGLERTLTTGIVSSLDRSLEAKNGRMIRGVIQTDASINPGNSGGPLLNARGEVIGMNTAIYSKVGQSSGIGFAVPISMIKRVLRPLIEQGYVERATIGITRVYRLDEGLLVLGVEAGGPADRAGIRSLRIQYVREGPFVRARIDPSSADVILLIDGVRVRSFGELLTEVEQHMPGETITVTVLRDGRPEEIPIRLGRTIVR